MKKIRTLWVFTGILLLINIGVYAFRLGGEEFLTIFSDSLPVLCAVISAVCLFYAFKVFKKLDFVKVAWILFLIGMTSNFIAETLYAVLEIVLKTDMNSTFPSIADYFWCGAYIPLFIGLLMMLWGYKKSGFPMGNAKLYVALAIALIILIPVITYLLFLPILKDPEINALEKFFYLFYPIADILIVIPAIILIYITSLFGSGTISRPWKYLSIGFVLFTLADLSYSYLSWKELYGSGNFIDLAWHSGYLLIGMAGLYQKQLIESFEQTKS